MRRISKILLVVISAAIVLLLLGAIINVATARSTTYIFVGLVLLALGVFLVRRIRRRNVHLRMADIILDPQEVDFSLPQPVNNLEEEVTLAILRNRAVVRARRSGRVAHRRNTDTTIRLVGLPKE